MEGLHPVILMEEEEEEAAEGLRRRQVIPVHIMRADMAMAEVVVISRILNMYFYRPHTQHEPPFALLVNVIVMGRVQTRE
jgi:hypothetical protein